MTTSKEIGNTLKEARAKLNLKPEDVYQKLRIHLRIIDNMENGDFDKLAPIYMHSFVKKYAELLGLDSKSILERLGAITLAPAHKPLLPPEPKSPAPAKQTASKPVRPKEETKVKEGKITAPQKAKETPAKTARPAAAGTPPSSSVNSHTMFVALLTVIAVVLIFILVDMLKSWSPSDKPSARPIKIAVQKAEAAVPGAAKAEDTTGQPVTLTLKAKGKVWVQAKSGDKNLFAKVMEKGDSETLKANGTIVVSTGKGENLEFTVNTRKFGVVADGVVKNIKVSAQGIKVGDSSAFPLS